MSSKKILMFFVLSILNSLCISLEPLTMAGTAAALAAVGSFVGYLANRESCPKTWSDKELIALRNDFDRRLYGQHLVKDRVSKLVHNHMMNNNPSKALVLSFHGWTGNGKNFVSDIIAENVYKTFKLKEKSNFVKHFLCTHFNTKDVHLIREWIKNNVTKTVKSCQRSLFIFDEIDSLPQGVIDAIKPFVDYNKMVDSVDYRKTIFIFLSNTGGTAINKKILEYNLQGNDRSQLKWMDLEPLVSSGAFNEKGGLHNSAIVDKNLIDTYVPFLPLEKKHIRLCIIDYLKTRHQKFNPLTDPGEEFINDVINEMEYLPPDTQLFSKTGCKKVGAKVDSML